MIKEIVAAGAGGFIGSAVRYAVCAAMASVSLKSGFPVGTLLVNMLGSFLIGVFWGMAPQGCWSSFLIAGICGGFTTFSAFSLETLRMLKAGTPFSALAYIVVSVLSCMLFAWLGMLAATGKTAR